MYTRHLPFHASVKEVYRLNKVGSHKETFHVTLDISASPLHYEVGDSVGILPSHDPALVQKTLDAMQASGSERIYDKRTQEERSLREHISSKVNITRMQRSIIEALHERQPKVHLEELLSDKEKLQAYLNSFELWDLLLEHPEVHFTPQEICDLLPPLLPRFYSIASALAAHPGEMHLTVAISDFEAGGKPRYGVGPHFLCRLAEKTTVPLYIQPSNGFTVPQEDHKPIIMVGPGTGIAPFRAFMQKRIATNASGKNWLFFGECRSTHDFYYEELWKGLEASGRLRLDTAFSRDQAHKIYVQHKMQENGSELWQWLQEGAHLFICGDADKMAKEVELALLQIIEVEGRLSSEEAKGYLKALRKEKRYLRDVY